MDNKQPYNSGVEETFSNFAKDPCLGKICKSKNICPVGFTCIRAVPPRSGEFRLDLSGCNLRCPFCWSINRPRSWDPEEICEYIRCRFGQFSASNLGVSIAYLRITGGEPILNERRACHLLEVFKLIDEDVKQSKLYGIWKTRKAPKNLIGRRNIKIQTNGVVLPRLRGVFIDELVNFKDIAFTLEVSLKGTNPDEFEILSGGLPGQMFFEQIRAIRELVKSENHGFPVFVRAILGIFHSTQYDLAFPNSDERMMLNPSAEFIEIVNELRALPRPQERVYIEPVRFTAQMRETEGNCRGMGIIAQSEFGKNIRAGKKTPITKTYLWQIIS